MKIPCDVIKDLLPLYYDGVCAENSKKIIEEHIAECDSCKIVLEKIKDNMLDSSIKAERENVVGHHKKAIKRKSFFWGISISVAILTLVLLSDALYSGDEWLSVMVIPALYGVYLVLFLINRHIKFNAFIRAGLCVISGVVLLGICVTILEWITEGVLRLRFSSANLLSWENIATINANIDLLVLLICGIVGTLLLLIGLLRRKSMNKGQE